MNQLGRSPAGLSMLSHATISLLIATGFVLTASGQVDDICREFGAIPTLDAPKLQAPFIYGKINVKGVAPGAKPPKIVITFSDASQPAVRHTLERSGNYCFKRTGGDGTLVVQVDGFEFARRTIPGFGSPQQREDFEVHADPSKRPTQPEVVSARFAYNRSERSTELFRKAAESESDKNRKRAIDLMNEVVTIDPSDFVAWAKVGSLHFDQNELPEAETAFKKALGLRVDYTPAWIYMGRIRIAQKQYEVAAEILKQAIETDPKSARAYQLLGEAYLQARLGTLGAAALKKALELDPEGMAESHLWLARLYDLAGAKSQATLEYKAFLKKVPEHPDKKKFEKYIKDNPN